MNSIVSGLQSIVYYIHIWIFILMERFFFVPRYSALQLRCLLFKQTTNNNNNERKHTATETSGPFLEWSTWNWLKSTWKCDSLIFSYLLHWMHVRIKNCIHLFSSVVWNTVHTFIHMHKHKHVQILHGISIDRAKNKKKEGGNMIIFTPHQSMPNHGNVLIIIHQKVISTRPINSRYEFVKIPNNYDCNTHTHARIAIWIMISSYD